MAQKSKCFRRQNTVIQIIYYLQLNCNNFFIFNNHGCREALNYSNVLVLSGINVFLVADIVPCFGFRTRMLMTHLCFNCCYRALKQNQGVFSFSYHLASEEAGEHKKLKVGTIRIADPNWRKEYSIP